MKKKFRRYFKNAAAGLSVLIACLPIWNVGTASAASTHTKIHDGVYQLLDGTPVPGILARGIDVSHWQGEIDWNKVASDDVSFVMLGTRYRGQVDPMFHNFASGASLAGIRLGAYIYSYATTVQEAEAEADFVINLVKDYPISYPIAFDMEDPSQGAFSSDHLADLANAFCNKIKAAGYYPIIYANDYWLENKLDMSKMDYDVWVARYETQHIYPDPVMWQATSTGSVNGINGGCDIDFQYQDFSGRIPADQWRTIGGENYYYKNYIMQKDTWAHDGTGWFYLNSQGHPHKGWLEENGLSYYLDASSGRMVEGWQQTADGWMYFGTSGAMQTGWVQDGSSRYYLDGKGIMQTGWLDDNNARYYLDGSGAMQTGWLDDGGAWYYLDSSGVMNTGWLRDGNDWYFLDGSGVMRTGWLQDRGASYYLKDTGAMAVGWRQVGDAWYYFDEGGAMQTGWVGDDAAWYYLDPSNGQMYANTQITVDGVNYLADANGVCTQVMPEAAAALEAQPDSSAALAPDAPAGEIPIVEPLQEPPMSAPQVRP